MAAVMLSLVRALSGSRSRTALSLSLSSIRRHDHLSDMCLAYLIARVRPSVPFPRTSRHRCRRRLLCSRVSERGWIGAVKNKRVQPDSGLRNSRYQIVMSTRRSDRVPTLGQGIVAFSLQMIS